MERLKDIKRRQLVSLLFKDTNNFKYQSFKGSDRQCMVVELSMQHCGQIL